jgi:hypothetical protein
MAKKERAALKARKTRPLHVCNVSIFAQREVGVGSGQNPLFCRAFSASRS